MSVWKSSCYRDDALQALSVHVKPENIDPAVPFYSGLMDWEIEPFGEYPVPDGIAPGNFLQQARKNQHLVKLIVQGTGKQATQAKKDLFDVLPKAICGLKGVYWLTAKLMQKNPALDRVGIGSQVHDLAMLNSFISKRTPHDTLIRRPITLKVCDRILAASDDILGSLLRLFGYYKRRQFKAIVKDAELEMRGYPPVENSDVKRLGALSAYTFPNMLILHYSSRSAVILRKDLYRIEKILRGFSKAKAYVEMYGVMTKEHRTMLVTATSNYQQMLRKLFISQVRVNDICRAVDVAYNYILAYYASRFDKEALHCQAEKYDREKLWEIVPLDDILKIVDGLPMREKLEVLSQYKCLPQPDFDYFGAAYRQQALYEKANEVKENEFFQTVLDWHKFLMIKAFYRRFHYLPGKVRDSGKDQPWAQFWPDRDPSLIPVEDMKHIDLEGSFYYEAHREDIWEFVKDKAVCPVNIEGMKTTEDLRRLQRKEKNQLVDVLMREKPIDLADLRDRFVHLPKHIKTDDKPEAKKKFGRWFMEAGTEVRLVISEYEENVASYGKFLEGYILGKDVKERAQMMNHVSQYAPEIFDFVTVFFSHDIEKFSPRLPLSVHIELQKQWAYAFGQPHIANLWHVLTDGDLHYVKRNVHHVLKKRGNDFEGFFGKELTFYHLAVCYAVTDTLLKEKKIREDRRFAVQIDDAVLRITFDKTKANLPMIRQRIGTLWKEAGMDISWDKTFVSPDMVVFLNEVRYQGRAVTPGMRAYIKMTNLSEDAIDSLPSDLAMIESTARGALFSGAPAFAVMILYLHLAVDAARRWDRGKHIENHAGYLRMYAPITMGGLGLKGITSMMGSLEYNSYLVGLSYMRMLSLILPNTREPIEQLMNTPVRRISNLAKLTNPSHIVHDVVQLKPSRLQLAMRKVIEAKLDSPALRVFGFQQGLELAEAFSDIVNDNQKVMVELRKMYVSCTVESFIDKLVQKATNVGTVRELAGNRFVKRLIATNINEAAKYFREYGK
jgi:hypothetical protein